MIEARDLTKLYGGKAAVDHLTFTVEPGRVTGFLGPNGAGKSTTMRIILGLDRPQAGTALINGRRYRDLRDPLRTVGALLEAKTARGSDWGSSPSVCWACWLSPASTRPALSAPRYWPSRAGYRCWPPRRWCSPLCCSS